MLQAISERAIEINSFEDYDYGYRQYMIKDPPTGAGVVGRSTQQAHVGLVTKVLS